MPKYFVALILVLCVMCGCAGSKISHYEGGMDAIKYSAQLVRAYEVPEGDKKKIVYGVLEIGKEIKLAEDTVGLAIIVKVLNASRLTYSLWDILDFTYKGEDYSHHIDHRFFSGAPLTKEFTGTLPLDNIQSATYRLEIRSGGEEPIEIGPISYSITRKQ